MKVAAQIGTTEGDYVQELADAGTIGRGRSAQQDYQTAYFSFRTETLTLSSWTQTCSQVLQQQVRRRDQTAGRHYRPCPMAFAVQKGNSELLDKINTRSQERKENGTYDDLVKNGSNQTSL